MRRGPKALDPFQRIAKWITEGAVTEDPRTECWLWHRTLNPGGYAATVMRPTPGMQKRILVHRWTYELHRDEIPAGLDIDHLCRVRNCVNPWHLEPVTRSENLKRAVGLGDHFKLRTHCKNQHEYTPEGTSYTPTGVRVCRACCREKQRRYVARRAAKKVAT